MNYRVVIHSIDLQDREVLVFSVDTMHLRGLRREAETGQLSHSAARQGLVQGQELPGDA